MTQPTRRGLLATIGAGGLAGLAGCTDLLSGAQDFSDHPANGLLEPGGVPFEEATREFMHEHDIPGGVLGVAVDGEIVVERGYGYRDEDLSQPMVPDTLVRIASLSKPLTRAAIRLLERRGEISFDDPVFGMLDLDPLPGDSYNERLDEITIAHLLTHRGGWDRKQSDDPVFAQMDIALERGWDSLPDERRLVRHMLGEPLQFDPGEGHSYSNLGYIVLGLVVETVTGQPYQTFLEEAVLGPYGIEDIRIGRSLPADRPDRETWYFDERTCPNVVELEPSELVRCPDGGFHNESMAASGGHVLSIGAYLRFMTEYWLNGLPRGNDETHLQWSQDGALPGTSSTALQRQGVDAVVVFNERGYDPNYSDIRSVLWDLIV